MGLFAGQTGGYEGGVQGCIGIRIKPTLCESPPILIA